MVRDPTPPPERSALMGSRSSLPSFARSVQSKSPALADAREIEQRGRPMVGRKVIGQAQGILMERLDLGSEQVFA